MVVNGLYPTSAKLSKAKRNYCVTRRALLAIVKILEHFNKYLYGQEFHLRTDHSAMTWLLNFRNLEGQTARCVQRPQKYNFTSVHSQGIRHTTQTPFPFAHAPRSALTARRWKERMAKGHG